MINPSAETNEPDPPLSKRIEDFCTCSSHAAVGSKWYLSFNIFSGGLLNSHMPSSARDASASPKTRRQITLRAQDAPRSPRRRCAAKSLLLQLARAVVGL